MWSELFRLRSIFMLQTIQTEWKVFFVYFCWVEKLTSERETSIEAIQITAKDEMHSMKIEMLWQIRKEIELEVQIQIEPKFNYYRLFF